MNRDWRPESLPGARGPAASLRAERHLARSREPHCVHRAETIPSTGRGRLRSFGGMGENDSPNAMPVMIVDSREC